MIRRMEIAMAIGTDKPRYAIEPVRARITRISSVAYAVEEIASDAKTASPTFLLITWCARVRVSSGRPISRLERLNRLVEGGVD